MPEWSVVARAHVLSAMREYDELGSREFLRRYGFGRSTAYTLWHQGKEYDSKAVLGVAYYHATGTVPRPDECSGGKDGAAKVLTDLGFDVVWTRRPWRPRSLDGRSPPSPSRLLPRGTPRRRCARRATWLSPRPGCATSATDRRPGRSWSWTGTAHDRGSARHRTPITARE
jgi:hypothetical protein